MLVVVESNCLAPGLRMRLLVLFEDSLRILGLVYIHQVKALLEVSRMVVGAFAVALHLKIVFSAQI